MTERTQPASPTTGGRTPQGLLAEESSLALPSLNEMDAVAIGERILARAIEDRLPVTIEVRRGSRVVFRAALPGTTPDNDDWVARKVRVVERFGHSSLYCRILHEAAGTTFHATTGLPEREYADHGGAVPLVVAGTGVVGVAVVSGLPQTEDHDLVVAGIREHLAGIATIAASIGSAAGSG
jgi:uncharacterized protein (UPF0303 family)